MEMIKKMRKTESRTITFSKNLLQTLDELIEKEVILSLSVFVSEAVKEKLEHDLIELEESKNRLDVVVNRFTTHRSVYVDDFEDVSVKELEEFTKSMKRLLRYKTAMEEIESKPPSKSGLNEFI
ncbi:Ribbon-helix-helix protein [Marine Group I thaumarchaeote SCGC AAA799-P11]|uniref:Ribbon-helix-helix protein n=1 Tax=Marine Group I thaumarchaeote SCGC AAA799-P11 TaxID=1502295 RepID=A0A087S1C6_9ARCH|nr:Ribbon-helix-helix protein [Marine Group I thaumarchaeote SCGC AAA799-P11]